MSQFLKECMKRGLKDFRKSQEEGIDFSEYLDDPSIRSVKATKYGIAASVVAQKFLKEGSACWVNIYDMSMPFHIETGENLYRLMDFIERKGLDRITTDRIQMPEEKYEPVLVAGKEVYLRKDRSTAMIDDRYISKVFRDINRRVVEAGLDFSVYMTGKSQEPIGESFEIISSGKSLILSGIVRQASGYELLDSVIRESVVNKLLYFHWGVDQAGFNRRLSEITSPL